MKKLAAKKKALRCLLICLGLATCCYAVNAQAVFKCQEAGKTVFKDHPCAGSQGTMAEDVARKEYEFNKRKQADAESKREREAVEAKQLQTDKIAASNYQARSAAVDRMTTYAVLMGRAVACNAPNTQAVSSRVGKWMDAEGLTKEYLAIFVAGMTQAAEQQRNGKTPDSCSKVRSIFASIPWP